jgi:hypothetical protein
LRTTTRSSDLRRLALAAGLCAALAGCTTPRQAHEFFELSPETPRHRATQTRFFETPDETELLSASAAALQDLGFQIEESVREVGFLRASKERSAREYRQEIVRFISALLGGNQMPVDLQQKIAAALVTRPDPRAPGRREVRVIFYRVVWQGEGSRSRGDGTSEYIPPGLQRMEMIREPEVYQQFFARLSKSVFLEAYTL